MQRFGKVAKQVFSDLEETADETIEGGHEWVVWRHQDFTERDPGSEIASGINPTGTDFETTDYAVQALRSPEDDRVVFHAQIAPSQGDLIITLRGNPRTREEALQADAAGFYCVNDTDEWRQDGELVTCIIETELDQMRDYSK